MLKHLMFRYLFKISKIQIKNLLIRLSWLQEIIVILNGKSETVDNKTFLSYLFVILPLLHLEKYI